MEAVLVEQDKEISGVDDGNSIIKVKDLHKYYDMGPTKVHALRGISIDVARGEFVAIMGSSGSGKSTFMNLLGCLDTPSEGAYWLEGTNVAELSRVELAKIRNKRVGFVFQGFNLLSRTSALENVELPLIYARIGTSERHRRSLEALHKVGLGARSHHLPSQLSGGQQQRVAVARALVNRPAILLADEPTGNLDSRTSVEIMQIFQELNANENLTIILVTHEPDISRYGKRVITFRDGHMIRDQQVQNRRNASDVLARMPQVED